MNRGNQHPQVFAALEESVCSDSDITFVVAFGSQISGVPNCSSDFDLALKFSDELSSRDRFEKRCFLSGSLQQNGAPFIDVVDLEALPLAVAYDALDGLFVCGDERAYEQFKQELETQFADQRDTLRRQQRNVIDRIAEEGLRG